MTEFERFGPWTGNALHMPSLPPHIAARRAKFWRCLALLALLAVICGGLAGLAHT